MVFPQQNVLYVTYFGNTFYDTTTTTNNQQQQQHVLVGRHLRFSYTSNVYKLYTRVTHTRNATSLSTTFFLRRKRFEINQSRLAHCQPIAGLILLYMVGQCALGPLLSAVYKSRLHRFHTKILFDFVIKVIIQHHG